MALSGDGWSRVIIDIFGWMVLDGCGWFWVPADSFGWIQVVSEVGFRWFAVLVTTVKFLALNLKAVDNCGKIL